jgi:hypothetical protein
MVREDRSIGGGFYCRRSNAEIGANVRELRVISHSDRTFASARILSPRNALRNFAVSIAVNVGCLEPSLTQCLLHVGGDGAERPPAYSTRI